MYITKQRLRASPTWWRLFEMSYRANLKIVNSEENDDAGKGNGIILKKDNSEQDMSDQCQHWKWTIEKEQLRTGKLWNKTNRKRENLKMDYSGKEKSKPKQSWIGTSDEKKKQTNRKHDYLKMTNLHINACKDIYE